MTVSYTQTPLLGKVSLKCQLTAQTGLHIGGGGENLDIGGLDKPVIRDPLTKYPYLPGSSIKGKLRATLERLLNKPLNRPGSRDTRRYESDDLADGFTEVERDRFIRYEGARTCQISRLFGSTGGSNFWMEIETAKKEGLFSDKSPTRTIQHENKNYNCVKISSGRNAPSRLIIRDSHLHPDSATQLKQVDTGLFMTEWKFENNIDRVTAAANPRQLERVPAGSKFNFELVYTVENAEQAVKDLENIAIALAFLEDDALGGNGSRGYGKVRFENFNFSYCSKNSYLQRIEHPEGLAAIQPLNTIRNTQELLDKFRTLREYIQPLLPGN
ncbi:type III-A CRISPR-associated RAMP protein Csm3 [Sphaerospermopsis kisseleviana CS-549]|uniref:CRISPR system Cms endoribonuclease Csm3 n=1 Tax=Sphaerospermopsis kisseleviana CS-549 TaxID=3021783 RepID=A0ABT4ZL15_9CYAN|nr:type III-A CRISPR-associated RAMP protein Csm3 [Sphaerospermopsis kisseleviana]MDB9440067.1 type III-A CRISPR-associated RAMP protein Csm3 [Sphaerospermopsis kisseleviana CS-549]BAZ81322.1 Csm3 family CRISPR-associated RAMP protein [Sphaerospermopsis kisseleviana NIES-73]